MRSREIGANATSDAFSISAPDAEGSLRTYVPSGEEELASSVRPSASTSVTTTPGSGRRDRLLEPATAEVMVPATAQAAAACARGNTGRSAGPRRHAPNATVCERRMRVGERTVLVRIDEKRPRRV